MPADVYEQWLGDHVRVWFIDQPALLRPRVPLRGRQRGLRGQPLRFAFLARRRLPPLSRRSSGRTSFTRTTGKPASCRSTCGRTSRTRPLSGAAGRCSRSTTSPTRGLSTPGWLPALGLGWDLLDGRRPGVLGPASACSRAASTSATGHHRQPELRAGDPDDRPGFGFEGIVQRRAGVLAGILNGIDTTAGTRGAIPHLPAPYSAGRPRRQARREARRCSRRTGCRSDERRCDARSSGWCRAWSIRRAWISWRPLAAQLPTLGAPFVVLGRAKPRYEEMWRGLAARVPDRFGGRARLRRAAGPPHRGAAPTSA